MLTYYVTIYSDEKCSYNSEIDNLSYGTLEEALNFLDEYSDRKGSFVLWRTIKDGEMIGKELINL